MGGAVPGKTIEPLYINGLADGGGFLIENDEHQNAGTGRFLYLSQGETLG